MNIGVLRGKIEFHGDKVIMMVGGLGFVIEPAFDFNDVETRTIFADVVQVSVRTIFREESIKHYAFLTDDDRMAFDRMLQVDGVGPVAASKIIAACALPALLNGDIKALSSIKGVGPKTAVKLVQEFTK